MKKIGVIGGVTNKWVYDVFDCHFVELVKIQQPEWIWLLPGYNNNKSHIPVKENIKLKFKQPLKEKTCMFKSCASVMYYLYETTVKNNALAKVANIISHPSKSMQKNDIIQQIE